MIDVFLSISTSCLITFFTIPIVISIVRQNEKFLDKPNSDRASHKVSVPTFGGIAIFCGILFSIIFWIKLGEYTVLQPILSALLIVFFIGVVDDLISLSPFKKLIGQLLAITVVIYFTDLRINSMYGIFTIHELPYWLSLLLTSFTMVVITNAYNLIDGLDGLAASVGIVMTFFFGLLFLINNQIEYVILSWSLTGALLGFLRFNFHPAKIFMGDTGSLVVGFLLSVFAINIVESNIVYEEFDFTAKGSALAIAILIVPLFDALRVFVIRASKGVSPLAPDRNHIHHNLSDLGYGHRRTSLYICLANLFFIGLVVFLRDLGVNYVLLIILLLAVVLSMIPVWMKKRRG
mgnify:CR=1 FL=1|tara:strand:- start:1077 stop:2120 length:1044 start_codon:yes stop_codon:yes gene_type:complete